MDKNITGLTAATTTVATDLLYLGRDPFGVTDDRKCSLTTFFNNLVVAPIPETNDGIALGDATHAFSDLFLASGGVINWNNGNLTLTHAANTLVLASDGLTTANMQVGTTSTDCGTFIMQKGAQVGDPKVTMGLSADANGDFSIVADIGDVTLEAGDDIVLDPNGGELLMGSAAIGMKWLIGTGTTRTYTGSAAGVARAFHWDIPVAAGGAAAAAIDYQFQVDSVLEAGLLTETDGAGTYREPVWKIPYSSADQAADWSSFTGPTPASLVNGGMVVVNNSNATASDRLYVYSGGAWGHIALNNNFIGPITLNGLITKDSSESVADDGIITLAIGVAGVLTVWTEAEYMQVYVDTAGAVSSITGSANTAITDSDGDLCVYDGGTGAVIKNRLAATKTVRYTYKYS